MMATRQNPASDPQAWPVVFIEPDPALANRKPRHPRRWVLIAVLLGVALPVGSWFAGRTAAPSGAAFVPAASRGDVPPGHAVAGLAGSPPRGVSPTLPAAAETAATFASADPPPLPAPRSRPRQVGARSRAEHRPAALAHLSINSYPWGVVTIDDNPVGNTPMVSLPTLPGSHRIRIERAGYVPFDRVIRMAPGEVVRLTGIVLQAPSP